MKAVQPKVTVADDVDGVMAAHGGIVGFSYFNIVWAFGFLPGSENATMYGVSTPQKKFVLCKFDGDVKEEFVGEREDLPRKFQRVIDFKFVFARDMDAKTLSKGFDDGVR